MLNVYKKVPDVYEKYIMHAKMRHLLRKNRMKMKNNPKKTGENRRKKQIKVKKTKEEKEKGKEITEGNIENPK